MAVRLAGEGGHIDLSIDFWKEILGIAQKFGCQLEGTCASWVDCDCENFGAIDHLLHQKDWDGNYVSCEWQVVSRQDGRNIAEALERATVAGEIPLDEHWIVEANYEKGGAYRYCVSDLRPVTDFLQNNWFVIGKVVLFLRNRRGRFSQLSIRPDTWISMLELIGNNDYEKADWLLQFARNGSGSIRKQTVSDGDGIDLSVALEDALLGTEKGTEVMDSVQKAGEDSVDRIWDTVDFCKGGSFSIL